MNNVISFKAKKNSSKEKKDNRSELEKKYAHEIAAMNQNCNDKEILETFQEDKELILEVFKMQSEITESIYEFIGTNISEENVLLAIKTLIAMSKKIRDNSVGAFGEEFKLKCDFSILKEFEDIIK